MGAPLGNRVVGPAGARGIGGGTALALVLVDHDDAFPRPAKLLGSEANRDPIVATLQDFEALTRLSLFAKVSGCRLQTADFGRDRHERAESVERTPERFDQNRRLPNL